MPRTHYFQADRIHYTWDVQHEPGLVVESGDVVTGSDPGAPSFPRLRNKLLWTTLVASVVFALFLAAYVTRIVTLDDLATLFGLLR